MTKTRTLLVILALSCTAFAQTPRLCLYEEFTGENCPPCAATNPGLNTLLASATNSTKAVAIKWQVPIPSAPSATWSLYQTNKADINWRYSTYGYGINSAPSGRMDGRNVTVFGAASDHPANLNNNVIATAQSYTSAFNVTMSRAWNPGCTAVTLTVNIQATANFNAVGSLVFRTVMVERVIDFTVAPGTNGEKHFEDVAIKAFPTIQSGIAMAPTWTVGQSQTFTLNCPLPSYTRKKSEVAFVGFIQDDGNREVAQACRVNPDPVPTDAISALGATVNVACSNTIAPQVSFKNEGQGAISGLTINPFVDGIAAAPYSWNGNLTAGSTTNIVLSSITSPTISGSHTFSFTFSTSAPNYNLLVNNNRTNYFVANTYAGTPVAEDFALASFPPQGWAVINADNGPTWSRVTNAGGFNLSMQSAKYDIYTNTKIGDIDELYLPASDLSGGNAPELSFDIAYAQRTMFNVDRLEVKLSDDCGATWTTVYSAAGPSLTSTTPYAATAYVPSPTDPTHWRNEFISLPGWNKSNVIAKFVVTNDNGNNIYIDNVNLSQSSPVGLTSNQGILADMHVVPNPSNGNMQIIVQGQANQSSQFELRNLLGQVVYLKNVDLQNGLNRITLDLQHLPKGVYTLTGKNALKVSSSKIIIE